MKTCSTCKIPQELSEFRNFARSKDGKGSQCRSCRKKVDNERYRTDPLRREAIRASNEKRVGHLRTYVRQYLTEHPCVDCGHTDPDVLEFDHVRGTKTANVSNLLKRAAALSIIQAEIAKCDVRCANCHRKRTVKQLGWYAWALPA